MLSTLAPWIYGYRCKEQRLWDEELQGATIGNNNCLWYNTILAVSGSGTFKRHGKMEKGFNPLDSGKEIKDISESREGIKLEWSLELGVMNWDDSMKAVKRNGEDWRIPTVDELIKAYVDKIPGFRPIYYWSRTENPDTSGYGMYIVNMKNGDVTYDSKRYPYSVRCVRKKK